jgi:DNA-binding NtrC family response regulator
MVAIGTRRAREERIVTDDEEAQSAESRPIWIVDDEPAAARLAADMCTARGAEAAVFPAPLPYLTALRSVGPPAAVVLDWRLENELSAALYLATRHRYPRLPVIYWTGSVTSKLPDMVRGDAMTVVVDKADGSVPFERALSWALDGAASGS